MASPPLRSLMRAPLGVCVAGLVLLGAELGVRAWGGVADLSPPSPLQFQAPGDRWPAAGPKEGLEVWGPWRRVAEADAQTYRVLVMGGSTTYGERVGPYQAFGGWLERSLRPESGEPVEVLNLGTGGFALRHVLDLLRHALASDTGGAIDLVILYSGNNEFLELLARKLTQPGFSSRQQLTRRRLWGLHGYRLLAGWLRPAAAPPPEGLPQPVTAMQSSADEDDRRLVERLYREGLAEAAALAREAGVPLLMATVADNLRSHPNLRVGEAERAWAAEKQATSYLPTLLAKPESHSAARWAALGEALWSAGQAEEALTAWHHAERLDPSPHRVNQRMREDLLRVGAAEGAAVCDVAGALASAGHIGDETFLDRCHPRPAGHRLIAEATARCLEAQGIVGSDGTQNPPDPYALDAWDVPQGSAPPPMEGWQAAMAEGHQAFVQRRVGQAWEAYRRAEALGAPEETLARSRAHLMRHDPLRFDEAELARLEAAGGI